MFGMSGVAVFWFASIRNVLVPDMKGAMQDILDTSHYVCQNIYGRWYSIEERDGLLALGLEPNISRPGVCQTFSIPAFTLSRKYCKTTHSPSRKYFTISQKYC